MFGAGRNLLKFVLLELNVGAKCWGRSKSPEVCVAETKCWGRSKSPEVCVARTKCWGRSKSPEVCVVVGARNLLKFVLLN